MATHLQESVVSIVDEREVLQPTNPVWNALDKETRNLQTSMCVSAND